MQELDYERYILSTMPTFWMPLYRKGGDTILSSDGHGFLGTVTGATWGLQGRTFNGTSDYINCGTDAGMPLGTANRTIMGWIKSNVNGAGNQVLGYGTFSAGQYFLVQLTSNSLRVSTHTNNYNGTITISINTWYHFAAMIDGANVKTFINIVADINTAHTGLNTTSSGKLYIGWEPNEPAGTTWDGLMGEIMVYNRALALTEIQQVYLATQGRYK